MKSFIQDGRNRIYESRTEGLTASDQEAGSCAEILEALKLEGKPKKEKTPAEGIYDAILGDLAKQWTADHAMSKWLDEE